MSRKGDRKTGRSVKGLRPADRTRPQRRQPAALILGLLGVAAVAAFGLATGGGAQPISLSPGEYGREAALAMPTVLELEEASGQPLNYRFVLEAVTAAPSTSEGKVRRLVPPDDLASSAAELAETFSLGTPQALDGDHLSEAEDGSYLWVAKDGSWLYSGPEALWQPYQCPEEDLVDGQCTSTPEPLLPADDEVQRQAAALVERLGLDAADTGTILRDQDAVGITIPIILDGSQGEATLEFAFGYKADTQLAWASGTTAVTEDVGTYPLLGPEEAALELERQLEAELDSPTVTISIVSVEMIDTMLLAEDGTWLLTPHYRLLDDEGRAWDILAVHPDQLAP